MKTPKSRLLAQLLGKYHVASFLNQNEANENSNQENAISRKEFISQLGKVGLSATALASVPLLTNCKNRNSKNEADKNEEKPKVAIIGGGIAGLSCANHFAKNGIAATIYEGSRRIGGRILTHYGDALENDVHPEFGGMFIDSNHEEMFSLAKEFGLETFSLLEDAEKNNLQFETFFFEGKHLSEKEILAEFKKVTPIMDKDANSLGDNYDTADAKRLDYISLEKYIADLPCKQWLKDLLTAAYVAEYGLETKEQSTLNMLSMITTDPKEHFEVFGESDEIYRIKGGNSLLTKKMEEKLKANIVYNSMLTKIENDEKGYKLSFKDLPDVTADYVIITMPFTKLREVEIHLKEMTPEKRNAIDKMGYGQNNKIAIAYQSRPWREGKNKFQGNLYHKAIINGLDGSDVRPAGSHAGAYLVYLGGDVSTRLASIATQNPKAPPTHTWKTDLPQNEIDFYLNELDTVFPGSKAQHTGKYVFACWSSYPFVNASYTCFKPGQWTEIMPHVDKPIGNVFFAGEHCSIDYQGFMNGGAETGRLAAEGIIEKIKTIVKK